MNKMNKKNLIPRIIVSPIILLMLIVLYVIVVVKIWLMFIANGWEFIVYKKDDKATIAEIYKMLKESKPKGYSTEFLRRIEQMFKEGSPTTARILDAYIKTTKKE